MKFPGIGKNAKNDPKYIEKCFETAKKYRDQELYDKSLDMYDKILSIEPNNVAAYFHKIDTLLLLNNDQETYKFVNEYMKTQNDANPFIYAHIGFALIALKEYDTALDVIDKAIAMDSNCIYAHQVKVFFMQVIKRPEEAKSCMDKAISCSTDFMLHTPFIDNCRLQKEYDLMLLYLDKFIQANPQNSLAHKRKIGCLVEMGRSNEALQASQNLIQIEPKEYTHHIGKAQLLVNMRMFKEARESIMTAIEIDPKRADAYKTIGEIMIEKGESERAIKYLKKAANLDPNNYEIQVNIAASYLNLGKYKEALQQANSIESQDPENWYNNHIIGTSLFNLGKHDKALKFIDKSLKFNPDHPSSLHHKGLILFSTGKTHKALEFMDMAAQKDPKNFNIYLNKGVMLTNIGRMDEAMQCIETAEKMGLEPNVAKTVKERLFGDTSYYTSADDNEDYADKTSWKHTKVLD